MYCPRCDAPQDPGWTSCYNCGRERDPECRIVDACKMCGRPRLPWQVFCGAACCVRWESGERPIEVKPIDGDCYDDAQWDEGGEG